NMEEALAECARSGECHDFLGRQFGVSFVDPVDQYLKSDRALKYALLFIALTFAGFFLFEVLKRLAVHPVQYGLVGLALAMFYLLLLSLAEHMAFALAYAVAASACVLLIGFYVSSVLHSWLRGAGFTAALAGLYAMLYALLSAEDYALLMGSLLVFGLLATVMLLTRTLHGSGPTRPAPGSLRPRHRAAAAAPFEDAHMIPLLLQFSACFALGLPVAGMLLIGLMFFGQFDLIH